MSAWSENIANYARARDSFAESLSEWSNALAEDPKSAQRVSQLLDGLISEMELLRDLGNMNAANTLVYYSKRSLIRRPKSQN
ncbi:uncharacterized protein N7469_000388 [Penicillium citrinum]|uniref:Uncharacterized protein n=1 Tax=Penicillium citrinum TaxID=5077 RepID=A0A9W9PCT2_PENCI|nr:uncharacterized protein N7469_000388 [Penicillium citrinum]KAJ5242061.1 hypothetical protein N7469_000388 [Penicillium citrinum]